jgi:hypothetical protein
MQYRVICTVKDLIHERISSIGCTDESGSRHTLTEEEAIRLIEANLASFYVDRPAGHRVTVVVEKTPEGRKFLKTEADEEKPNNLLSLPHCDTAAVVTPAPRVIRPAYSHGVRQ